MNGSKVSIPGLQHTYMSRWYWVTSALDVGRSAATCPDDGLVAMQVDLRLQLVPQFVVFRTFHVPSQQLDLLDSGS